MKIKHFLLSAIVLATSLASCVDDKEYVYDGGNGVKFNSTVAGQSPMARAANAAWQQGDAIGVYMKTGTGLDNIVDGAANKKHTTPGNGMFSPADPMTDAIFFPKSGAVDFIAYYPYSATLAANIYKVDVTNQTSQEKIDLLYSNDATGKSSGDNVVLGFKHELTKVVFNLVATEASADLTNVKVSIGNMPVKADFNLATGALTVDATMASIDMKSTVDPNTVLKAVAEGIVIPTAKAERKFTFTFKVGGAEIVKTWDAKDEPFDKGMKNSYNVQLVSDKGIIVSPSSNIQDWGPGSSEDIIIDLDGETTPGDGTQANPFTVEEAAAKVGENAKWVTGFIVGSTNTAKAVGTPSKDNIILATTKGETDESKWIIVDIKDSPVAKFLDIVASPDLVGAKVKVQGNIVNNIFGGVLAMTTITAQEGGKEGGTTPGGEEKEFFFENFGPDDKIYGGKDNPPRPKVEAGEWLMAAPIEYSDLPKGTFDIRSSAGTPPYTPSLWIPANKPASFIINGIEGQGYSKIKLSYKLAAGFLTAGQTTNVTEIKVKANGQDITIPSMVLDTQNVYSTVTVDVPDNITTLEFITASTLGFRLDDIKLVGTK